MQRTRFSGDSDRRFASPLHLWLSTPATFPFMLLSPPLRCIGAVRFAPPGCLRWIPISGPPARKFPCATPLSRVSNRLFALHLRHDPLDRGLHRRADRHGAVKLSLSSLRRSGIYTLDSHLPPAFSAQLFTSLWHEKAQLRRGPWPSLTRTAAASPQTMPLRTTLTSQPRSHADIDEIMSDGSTDVEALFSDISSVDSASDVDSSSAEKGPAGVREDHLLERIAFHKSQGRARSRRKPWSQSLVERELDFWRQCVTLLPTRSV